MAPTHSKGLSYSYVLARVVVALALTIGLSASPVLAESDECSPNAGAVASDYFPSDDDTPKYDTRLVSLIINNVNTGLISAVLQTRCGALLVLEDDLRALRVKTEQYYAIAIAGEYYISLKDLPTAVYGLDQTNLALYIDFHPDALRGVIVDLSPINQVPLSPTTGGAYLQYSLTTPLDENLEEFNVGGLVTAGAFGKFGTVRSRWFGANVGKPAQLIFRENTVYQRDFEASRMRLRIGDVFNQPRAGGSAYALAGIQLTNNDALLSNYDFRPSINFQGVTAREALVTLSREPITANPADSDLGTAVYNFPDTHDYGSISLLNVPVAFNTRYYFTIRDIEGGLQVQSRETYFSHRLLKQGKWDYSAELGLRRLGTEKYGGFVATASARRGISSWLTSEGHMEFAEGNYILGLGGSIAAPYIGGVSLALTTSDYSSDGTDLSGTKARLDVENIFSNFRYSFDYEVFSRDFRRPTQNLSVLPVASTGSIRVGFKVPSRFGMTLGYRQSEPRDSERQQSASVSFSPTFTSGMALSFIVAREISPDSDVFYGVNFSSSFDALASASGFNRNRRRSRDNARYSSINTSFSKNHSGDILGRVSSGFSYGNDRNGIDVQGSTDLADSGSQNLRIGYRGQYFRAAASLRHTSGNFSGNGSISGGFVWLNETKKLYAKPEVLNSFALVRLGPNLANVRVNNVYTDEQGDVLLGDLAPYQTLTLNLNQNDLPLGAVIDPQDLKVRIGFNNAALFEYDVPLYRDVLITVELNDGQNTPLPIGANAVLRDNPSDELPVGDDGLIYVTGVTNGSILDISWESFRCSVSIEVSESMLIDDDIPELGPYLCGE